MLIHNVIIAGGREFDDYELLKTSCDEIIANINSPLIQIVEGEARGADLLGKKYAIEKSYQVIEMPAKWTNKFGLYDKEAGLKRNIKMAHIGQTLIAFWDGESTGTGHMIKVARKHGLTVRTIKYPKDGSLQNKRQK